MKGLILKDLYNIAHNARSMMFTLAILAVALIPSGSANGYVFSTAIICSMQIVTTFSFDEHAGWTRYAVAMPVSRRQVVAAKYIVMAVFAGIGVLLGVVIGAVGGLLTGEFVLGSADVLIQLLMGMFALGITLIFGGAIIPLLLRFGVERGRVLMLAAAMLPAALAAIAYLLLRTLNIQLTDEVRSVLLCCAPLAAVPMNAVLYRISCRLFENKEL